MRALRRASFAALACAALVSACGVEGGDGGVRHDADASAHASSARVAGDGRVDRRPGTSPADPAGDAAIQARAAHVGGRTWVLTGTAPTGQPLEVSVEDGRYVLYGPEPVPVRDGKFRVELKLPATDRPTSLHAFLGDPKGERQVVVALPR
ncbi:MAG: hypothetical protein JWM27_2892 [Gemmatimonadetes bacterium]|nr:hypothetical protein [Gemmatimonadota bacterium]